MSRKHGYSVREIINDKIKIFFKLYTNFKKDTEKDHVISLSREINGLAKIFNKIKPDIVLVTGDRAEMFAATFAAVYMNIAVAHIQSGDLSGHIDGSVRHSITKLAHVHFSSCRDSANRVLKMGEQKWRVFNTGAPQIDDFFKPIKITNKKFENKYKIKLRKFFFVIIQHPILFEKDQSSDQILKTLKAVEKFDYQKILIYPNIDPGKDNIIKQIKRFEKKRNFIILKNIERDYFIYLLSKAKILIGNSSSGIIEASSFKLPVINIGNRQRGRLQSSNIVNVTHSEKFIFNTILKILKKKKLIKKLKKCRNPYGNGDSSKKIVHILKNIKINKKLLDKENTY